MPRPTPATNVELDSFLTETPRWTHECGRLVSTYAFREFRDAMEFMGRVAAHAERLDHHPDWSNSYRTVNVELMTHSAGAITALDFELARAMDVEAAAVLRATPGEGSTEE